MGCRVDGNAGARGLHLAPPRHRARAWPVPRRSTRRRVRGARVTKESARPRRRPQPRQVGLRLAIRTARLDGQAMSVLVGDFGTSGVRASVVGVDANVTAVHHREVLPASPAQGFVEFDASVMAVAVLEVARAALSFAGPVYAVGSCTDLPHT